MSTEFSATDHAMMSRALQLAKQGLYTTRPNPRVGCVVVKNGEIIGEGWHERAGESHAEVHALKQAGAAAKGSTAYVTLEPCSHFGRTPPCTNALVEAGVAKVVMAMLDPNPLVAGSGKKFLQQQGINVEVGLLYGEAYQLNQGFCQRMTIKRPLVRCKLAMSVDGRTAKASGESQWITGADARADVQQWRARSCAVITGIKTVLDDDASLTVRSEQLKIEAAKTCPPPLRVIVDSQLKTPVTAKIFNGAGKVLVATTCKESNAISRIEKLGAEVVVFNESSTTDPAGGDNASQQVPLDLLLNYLADHGHCNEVMIEAGSTLAGAFVKAGLVDELIVYMAPVIMGHEAKPLLTVFDMPKMADNVALEIKDVRQIGKDWRMLIQPINKLN
ncbi:bifunctional diaminohydroxyphosphoribosylaminopyrimidine deaminase/5-amino-6-(5-phosphoribosylamino)uracil reductase RibD [Spartinivicinus poritis]|uniref:Riboflavin biosynthesis protein RibD n=1 Tax=Spartinivicinus poritis TaxID=2994640 RepID=A0ABT5U637_9GAMM|nr:bifunctional diaminohydroxyphosphoribosylaminopyrimidine deaminase/5-amino-6-(5-phosphoribosylamino)uracil reductase RibD [Spartinivicinus sp. A2-2]MDE1461829.1 bifunctional diaminohydroxyphosphoribosylaminopyrimidine deaminase/5-amino-6-(5-phosphoribosylamino)uracil reductase RibD [Spartinivicinus sp. A2-2]